MKLEYSKYTDDYDPISISWEIEGIARELKFDKTISAQFSEELNSIVVELYEDDKLNFYSLNGELLSSERIPKMDGYQFRGLNKSLKSRTGIALLFLPDAKESDLGLADIEQYEMLSTPNARVGGYLNIFR